MEAVMTMTNAKVLEFGIIVVGCAMAFLASFNPQLAMGYHLDVGILLAGLLPYLVYSVAVVLLDGALITLLGIVLIVIHAWVIVNVRFVDAGGYSSDLLVNVPLILSVVMLPAAIVACRKPYGV